MNKKNSRITVCRCIALRISSRFKFTTLHISVLIVLMKDLFPVSMAFNSLACA